MLRKCRKVFSYCSPCVWVCMGVRVRACVNVCAVLGSVWFGASRPNI